MADQEVALQVKTPSPPPVPAYDPASMLSSAQTILGNQTALQAGQTNLQMLNRQNAGQDIQYRNQLISSAAAHALDSDSWDAAMRAAVQKGAPEAQQYIGRYTPLLQQRLFDAYAGAPQGGQGAGSSALAQSPTTSPDILDRRYQNATPAQMAAVLQRTNTILAALSTIKDQPSQDRAIDGLVAAGIPGAAALRGPYSSLAVTNLYNKVMQHAEYLQDRVASASAGAPNPPVKTEMQVVDKTGYDPYTGRPMTVPTPEKIGTDTLGNDVYGIRDPNAPQGYRRIDPSTMPQTGAGVSIEDAARRIQPTENTTGNPAATNPRSSATGNDQFIDGTWLSTIKTAMPELAKAMNDKQLLALRSVPAIDSAMTVELAKQNATALRKADVPVTTATIALAHKFGADGATKIFDANPNTPMEQVFPPKTVDGKTVDNPVIAANPELKGRTTGDYLQGLINSGVRNDPVNVGGTTTATNPTDATKNGRIGPLPGPAENIAQAMAHYDYPAQMAGYALTRKGGQALIGRAMEIAQDEGRTFDFTDYANKNKSVQAFGSGKQGQQITFFNNSVQHLGTLDSLISAMGNGDVKALNAVSNAFKEQFGQPAPGNFDAAKNIVGQEIVKSIVANGGGEAERQAAAQTLSAAKSPEQLRGIIDTYKELAGAQLRDLKVQYEQNTGRKDFDTKLIPESKDQLDKVMARANARQAAPQSSATNTPPVPGAKLYQGNWYTRGPNGEAVLVKQ